MENKNKKRTINISLQAKKYMVPMNTLIEKWEDEGENLSIKLCDDILKYEELQSYPSMIKVLNVFDLVKKTLEIYGITDLNRIEEVFSSVIHVDMTALNEVFLTLNQIQGSSEMKPQAAEKPAPAKNEVEEPAQSKVEAKPIVEKVEALVQEEVEADPFGTDIDISEDLLFNS